MKNYRTCIVSVLDILGFKEYVSNHSCEEVAEILGSFKYFGDPPDRLSKEVKELNELSILNFSDLIIRIIPLDNQSNLNYRGGILFHEFIDLIHIQGELICKGILIRGGVALGDVYYDNDMLFGSGVINAHLLESKVAKYPRIVIESELLDEFETNPLLQDQFNALEYQRDEINGLICDDKSRVSFIDYLNVMKHEVDCSDYYKLLLLKHKEITEKGLLETDVKVQEKYCCLKNYHNETIRRLSVEYFKAWGITKKDLYVTL